MGLQAWLSQGLLLLMGLGGLFSDGFLDIHPLLSLLALLCALLMNLLGKGFMFEGLALVYLALCWVFPGLLAFFPLLCYLALDKARLWVLFPALLTLIAVKPMMPWWLLVLFLLCAMLLYLKDRGTALLQSRYFTLTDSQREQQSALEKEVTLLRQNQEAEQKLAISQERNRIARDIHDNVGHLLSRSILQLAALGTQTKDEEAKQELEMLKDTLTTAMNATRHSVHNTRQDTLYLDQEVNKLLEDFTFCPVRYVNTTRDELSLNSKYAVMAIIKEALNNVMRHSNATQVSITLSQNAGDHVLLIADNGTKTATVPGGGLGLMAMQDRVAARGGSLHISKERGFRLLITLPVEEKQ